MKSVAHKTHQSKGSNKTRIKKLLPYFNDIIIAREVGLTRERIRQIRNAYHVQKLPKIHCSPIITEELLSKIKAFCSQYPLLGSYLVSVKMNISRCTATKALKLLNINNPIKMRNPLWLDFCDFIQAGYNKGDIGKFADQYNLNHYSLNSIYRWKRQYDKYKNGGVHG